MNDLELVRAFEDSGQGCLTTRQVALMFRTDMHTASDGLARAVAKGIVVRVIRGVYTLPSSHVLAVASGIYSPSYVSFMAAFEHYGTTTQFVRIIDVVNPKRSGNIDIELDSGSYVVRFVKLTPDLIFGMAKTRRGKKIAVVAEKEKAIVDSLMLPRYAPADETFQCVNDGIDPKKTLEYAERTGRQSVIKRAGYMLKTAGYECTPSDLSVELSDTFVPLDPANERTGKYDMNWRVIANKVI